MRPSAVGTDWNECAEPCVAQVQTTPEQDPEIDTEQDVGEKRAADAQVRRYRAAGPGTETEEKAVPMTRGPNGRYAAAIPGHKAGQIVRFRVRAADGNGGERFVPGPTDLRPALSAYVHDGSRPGKVPFGFVINVGRAEFRAALADIGQYNRPPHVDPPASEAPPPAGPRRPGQERPPSERQRALIRTLLHEQGA